MKKIMQQAIKKFSPLAIACLAPLVMACSTETRDAFYTDAGNRTIISSLPSGLVPYGAKEAYAREYQKERALDEARANNKPEYIYKNGKRTWIYVNALGEGFGAIKLRDGNFEYYHDGEYLPVPKRKELIIRE